MMRVTRHVVGVERVEHVAVARERDGGLDQLAHGSLPKLRCAQRQARDRAGHAGRARPDAGCRCVGLPAASRYMSRVAAPGAVSR